MKALVYQGPGKKALEERPPRPVWKGASRAASGLDFCSRAFRSPGPTSTLHSDSATKSRNKRPS